jgi:hypothetical protein
MVGIIDTTVLRIISKIRTFFYKMPTAGSNPDLLRRPETQHSNEPSALSSQSGVKASAS